MAILGKSEEVLFSGRLMKKKELKLPPGEIAVHLLRNLNNMMNKKNLKTCIQGRLPLKACIS
jgi:hypothetical protein